MRYVKEAILNSFKILESPRCDQHWEHLRWLPFLLRINAMEDKPGSHTQITRRCSSTVLFQSFLIEF